jgi:hypothetical protein
VTQENRERNAMRLTRTILFAACLLSLTFATRCGKKENRDKSGRRCQS